MEHLRTDIEKALDELISNEEGMRFQGLAVVLAKLRWPQLIARERKRDLGLDAYMPASTSPDGIGKGLACSLTATLSKIEDDIKSFKQDVDDVKVLLFATPCRVTRFTETRWAEVIERTYGITLFVLPREDIITELMKPSNAPICRSHLGIFVPVKPTEAELFEKAQAAATEVVGIWLSHPRLIGRPKIALQAAKLDRDGRETGEILDLESIQAALSESRRIVLEAPAGRGKTTMLIQLADRICRHGELAFLIDLPAWVTSTGDILDFIARMPSFLSRAISSQDLARLCETMQCSFLLNGWNEVSDSYSDVAVHSIANLEHNFPKAGLIVATRTHHIRPPLPGSFRAKVLLLNEQQRTEYLRQSLAERADNLSSQINGDRVLDDLTRTPLFLAEVTNIFVSGGPIPKTKVGVLGAVIRLVEESDEHRDHMQRRPIAGYASDYMAGLAVQMTAQGDVTIEEACARSTIYSISLRLNSNGQIAMSPDPGAILNELSAHHVLERVEYPSVGFRFEHQQFQEFYSAMEIQRQLQNLVGKKDPDASLRIVMEYVNRPAWDEPLRMVAEEIGEASVNSSRSATAVATGRRLIELSLMIDPVFAADLAHICGSSVWKEVRGAVGERLREWYRVANEDHQQCALAGMLASGSDDFIDILLPLLTSDDQQVRLKAYRAWGEFHVSSLGTDWRHVVGAWKEEHRVDFVSEVMRKRRMADIAEGFAREDASSRVDATALQALDWVGATDAVTRILTAYSGDAFEQVLRKRVLHSIPLALHSRALATYEKLLRDEEVPSERLRIWLAISRLGGQHVLEGIKEELNRWPSGKMGDGEQLLIKSALDLIRKADAYWVSQWVAGRITEGSLWFNHWEALISKISDPFRQSLFERISGEEIDQASTFRIVPVLGATADVELAGSVFSRLCSLRTGVSSTGEMDTTRWAIIRQLENLFRTLPPNLAVSGILSRLSPQFDPGEYKVVIGLLGGFGDENPDLRSQLPDNHHQALRRYLKEGISFVLSQDDFSGEQKAHVSVALAGIGEREDVEDLLRLIRADIERMRRGRAARLRRERSPLANGAMMAYSNWHVRAVASLDPQSTEKILLDVLCEPEYEQDAVAALVQLARTQDPEKGLSFRKPDYSLVSKARSQRQATGFEEDRRHRYVTAIKRRISTIMEQRLQNGKPDSFNGRLKILARAIATLDGHESAEFVMEIMALPGEWDGWVRADALEALLFSGAVLGAEATLAVLNPTIEHILTKTPYDQQAIYLLRRYLCILPFLDPPSIGIARIREVLAAKRIAGYELREVVTALGHSRCNEALDLLLEIETTGGNGLKQIAGEWIDAIADLDTSQSRQVLLSFVDPDIEHSRIDEHLDYHEGGHLASHIANVARAELAIKDRLYLLCARQLSTAPRLLLADALTRLGTMDALLVCLDLIHDDATPPIPYELARGVESVVLEQRPYGNTGNVYTLEPRSANEVRIRLFNMILNDKSRKLSACALLGQIERWRLEYGRPISEPRHPAFESGELWPPSRLI